MELFTLNDVFVRLSQTQKSRADVWWIHGFGESGLSFREAFNSKIAEDYNLVAVDLPGFGVSPCPERAPSLQDSSKDLAVLINEISGERPLVIVAHSLGGVLGSWIAKQFEDQVIGFVNVEGVLTSADLTYSGMTQKVSSADDFYPFFMNKIYSKLGEDPALHRYYASLQFADPDALYAWGRSAITTVREQKVGDEFSKLSCPKVYFWGDQSTPKLTQEFLKKNDLPQVRFRGVGHWPMVERSEQFYSTLGQQLAEWD